MCRIVVGVKFIKNVLIDDVSYCGKSYIHKNVMIDDVSYCGKSYIHKNVLIHDVSFCYRVTFIKKCVDR